MMFTEVRRYAVIQLSPMGCCLGRLQFMRESGGETRRSGVRDVVKEYVHMIMIGHGACIAGRFGWQGRMEEAIMDGIARSPRLLSVNQAVRVRSEL